LAFFEVWDSRSDCKCLNWEDALDFILIDDWRFLNS